MENGIFIIPLNGLTASGLDFTWNAGKEFFETFGNSEIMDAGILVDCSVAKIAGKVMVDCSVSGSVTVQCDRCLEDLIMPVSIDIPLLVKFGDVEETPDEEREVIAVEATDTELDLGQIIYDYVCLSLPIQRIHPDGGCNPEVVKYMAGGADVADSADDVDTCSPFASLKGLF